MNAKKIFLALVCLSIAFPFQAFSKGDPAKGKPIYGAICSGCHGANGEGLEVLHSPRLVGFKEDYLVSQLEKFRSGLRGAHPDDKHGQVMARFAENLVARYSNYTNPTELQSDVAAYIGTLESQIPSRTETTGDPVKGANLYNGELRCVNCHGLEGRGLEQSFEGIDPPRLAGQFDWYLIRQMQNFRDGIRGDSKDMAAIQMGAIAKVLLVSDQKIMDIAAYLSTQE